MASKSFNDSMYFNAIKYEAGSPLVACKDDVTTLMASASALVAKSAEKAQDEKRARTAMERMFRFIREAPG